MSCLDAEPLLTVPDHDFRRYQRLMLEKAGIFLNESKRTLLAARLARRLRLLGLNSYGRYLDRLRADPDEYVEMFDLLLTNETSFFREPAQFRFVEEKLVPMWLHEAETMHRKRSLQIWSAGCATGEEPYSLAMLLRAGLPGWTVRILATDLSTRALRHAREGVWPSAKAADIPEALLRRFMLRGVGERAGAVKAGPEIRSLVQFERLNLHEPQQCERGPFDLILCRNVLIYFEEQARRRAFERLISTCALGGYLFVGHAETLQGYPSLSSVQPTIWRRNS